MKRSSLFFIVLGIVSIMVSCGEEVLPKPKGLLRLNYPPPVYEALQIDCSYSFEKSKIAELQQAKYKRACWYNVYYPELKATIYVSYYKINNNLDSLLRDAQNLTQEHYIKADAIKPESYSNKEKKVYGVLYKVSGNAASSSQFYVTDSVHHFVSGSVYFRARPNYDSILPAAQYLYNDIKHLVETIEWKE